MKIQRTYPQPDSPQPNIGPRERAMAVLKYLLDIEPEDAVRHHGFPLLVASYEQAGRAAIRKWANETWDNMTPKPSGLLVINRNPDPRTPGKESIQGMLPELPDSIVELLTAETEGTMRVQPFVKDGL